MSNSSDSFLATLKSYSLPVFDEKLHRPLREWTSSKLYASRKNGFKFRTRSVSPLRISNDSSMSYDIPTLSSRARSISQPAVTKSYSRWMLSTRSSPQQMQKERTISRRRSRSRDKRQTNTISSDTKVKTNKIQGSYFHADEFYRQKITEILFSDTLENMPSKPTKLLDHLYIGNYRDARHHAYLNRIGITHVLNCAAGETYTNSNKHKGSSPYPHSSGVVYYKTLHADDNEGYNMMKHIEETKNFIDDAKRRKGRCFVHCAMGVNRSGFVCIAYVMIEKNMGLLEALETVRKKHGPVVCNPSFQKQLIRVARSHGLLKPVYIKQS